MKHEQGSKQVAMIDGQSMPPVKAVSLAADPQIQRIRRILLIILCNFVAVNVIRTIVAIVTFIIGNSVNRPENAVSIVEELLSLVFDSFGFYVTYKYHKLGLRVFAWLMALLLCLSGIGLVLVVVSLATRIFLNSDEGAQNRHVSSGLPIYMYFVVFIWIVAFILGIIVTVLVFKLAKLIRMKKSETTTPI
ncbi:unnamed protein product [Rotaria magnacalcarata]